MNDDRVLRILEEIRDLQRANVANYQEALRNQHESITLQQAAVRRVRVIMAVAAAALIVAVGMFVMLLLRLATRTS